MGVLGFSSSPPSHTTIVHSTSGAHRAHSLHEPCLQPGCWCLGLSHALLAACECTCIVATVVSGILPRSHNPCIPLFGNEFTAYDPNSLYWTLIDAHQREQFKGHGMRKQICLHEFVSFIFVSVAFDITTMSMHISSSLLAAAESVNSFLHGLRSWKSCHTRAGQ